jgi:hypothetical protein
MQRAYIIHRHSSKTFAAILFIILLSIIDAYLTLDLVSRGAEELNPVMAYYLDHSPLTFFGAKYFLTCAAIILVLGVKSISLFKSKVQGRMLFIFYAVALGMVVQWELYLIIYRI